MEHPGTAAAADDRERVVAELARLVGKVNPPRMGDGSHHHEKVIAEIVLKNENSVDQ